ncbi:MAG TPA: GNAT family N-acetyltransferase [Steroidobacteraceae bacterium]|jgi:ribosomal-protein-alanine N-acetyltransferase|nr:GNAT family N-acetyltransferase [Steroidobacteraceae bacterium]
MITDASIRLANPADAAEIAALSRDQIEQGLGWSWTTARVARAIRDPETNVAVVRDTRSLLAFGIMSYRDQAAHLLLFAVRESHQRLGIGSAILRWLEDVAREAGIRQIHVECRRNNSVARNFYGEHGYHEHVISPGYYQGVEDAVRMEKWLRPPE